MYSELGQKIHKLRMINNMPAKFLANKIGVTTQQMYKYEKGVNRIPISRLMVIAEIFNKPIEYFIADLDSTKLIASSSHTIEEIAPLADKKKSIRFTADHLPV